MKYLKYGLLFLLVVSGVLTLFFYVYRVGYRKYYAHEIALMEEKINGKAYHDLLFMGSSCTFYVIDPKIVDSVTRLDTYNAGMDGANLVEMNMVLDCYLKNHKPPKYLVMDIPTNAFDSKQRPFFNPNLYYPFLNNDVVFEGLKPVKRVYMLKYLPFTQLTEVDDNMRQNAIFGYFGRTFSTDTTYYKGHCHGGPDTLRLPFTRVAPFQNFPIDSTGIGYFERLVQTCRQHQIKLIAYFPAVYKYNEENLNPQFFPTVRRLLMHDNIPFLYYRELPVTSNHKLFRDEHHFNKTGSVYFSNLIGRDIDKIIQSNELALQAHP